MGRGIAYPYEHFIIIDEHEIAEQCEGDDLLFDEYIEEIKYSFCAAFKCDLYTKMDYSAGRKAFYFAESDRLKLGIDISGALPCIFIEPLTYEASPYTEKEYKVSRDVERAFSKIRQFWRGNPVLRKAVSAWTSVNFA